LDESPGPVLVLRGSHQQADVVLRRLMRRQPEAWGCPNEDSPDEDSPEVSRVDEGSAIGVAIPGWLRSVTQPPTNRDSQVLLRLRDRLVLQALVRGARLHRHLETTPCVIEEPLEVEPCDYETVRGLLRSSLIDSAEEPVDPVAVAMVNRANVFLEMKYTPELWQEHPIFWLDGDPMDRLRGCRTQRELVARREIAELGNVRSRLVRQIVESLKQLPNGHALYQRMGLMRRPPSESAWRSHSASALLGLLHQWSVKQVRRHFDDRP